MASWRGGLPLIRDGSAVAIRSYHTDGQGAFSFETDRTADQLLVAKAAGHASSEIALNTTGTVAELNVNFRLRPAGTVRGRVVDENGNGVGGATIQVRYPGELRRHHFHDEVGDIQADDFGYFTLPVVARGKGFVVESATAERLPGATAPLTLDGDERSGVQVTAGWIRFVVGGAVKDSAANPHRGVAVRLRLLPGSETAAAARFSAPCAFAEPKDNHGARRGLRVQRPAGRKGGGDRPRAGQDARQEGTRLVGTGFTRDAYTLDLIVD